MSEIFNRLAEQGLHLPDLGDPAYSYEAFTSHQGIVYISGQISRNHDGTIITGCVGEDATVEEGVHAAQIATLNLLARVHQAAGLENVEKILKLNVWVNSTAGFQDQPAVAEGASKMLIDALGTAGAHARTALPVHTLPKGALVELDAIVAVRA